MVPAGGRVPHRERRTVRAVGNQPARRPYRDGLAIAVVYDPRDPQQITVGAERARLFVVAGIVFLVISAVMAVGLLVVL